MTAPNQTDIDAMLTAMLAPPRRVGDRAFTVQAHPEFKDEFVDGLMKTRGKGVVPDALMAEAGARLGSEIHDQTIAERIAAFFKAPRGAS